MGLEDRCIISCLEYFDYSPEELINAILENNLPAHIASLDKNMTIKELISQKPNEVDKHSIFPPRNLQDTFDLSDTFDLENMPRSNWISSIHQGKKPREKNANILLNDKKDLSLESKEMQNRFAALGIVDDNGVTYNDKNVGGHEPNENESGFHRPFVLPQALGGGHITYVETIQIQDDNDSDDSTENERDKNPLNFVSNPEEKRKEAEKRRKKKCGNPVRNVVGNAKGEGQEKRVVINRKKKNVNKGKRVRSAADFKYSRGMF